MNIYVIIVTYNGAPWIRGALESVRRSEAPCTAVVVDNASGDGTAAIVRSEFPEAVLIALDENTGFGRGNNVGISLAIARGAEYVFLLNQDAFLTPPALGLLKQFLDQHAEYGLATPLHCSPDLNAVDPLTLGGYLQRYAPGYLSDACLGLTKPHYDIHGLNAAAWMVRTAVFRRVGGFDPLFFMYGEDDDLLARFAYLGERCALLPASRVVHLRARSARPPVSLPRQLWNLSERPRSELLIDMKHPNGTLPGKLLRLLSNGMVLPLGRLLGDHDWRKGCAFLIATFRVLAEVPRILRSARRCASAGPHYLDI